MSTDIVTTPARPLAAMDGPTDAPAIVVRAGDAARFAWAEFFGGEIENEHTRRAYLNAVQRFLAWCEQRGLELHNTPPAAVGEYMRELPSSIFNQSHTEEAVRKEFLTYLDKRLKEVFISLWQDELACNHTSE